MKKIRLLCKTTTVDTNYWAKNIIDTHKAKTETHIALVIGMLNDDLIEVFKKNITDEIISKFSAIALELYRKEINDFIDSCIEEVIKQVYDQTYSGL